MNASTRRGDDGWRIKARPHRSDLIPQDDFQQPIFADADATALRLASVLDHTGGAVAALLASSSR